MSVVIRKNSRTAKTEAERMESVREKIRSAEGRSVEDREIYVAQLRERVRKYERRYERSSAAMLRSLQTGRLKETRDISIWAWTWQTLKRLEEETPTTGTR